MLKIDFANSDNVRRNLSASGKMSGRVDRKALNSLEHGKPVGEEGETKRVDKTYAGVKNALGWR